jgi:hypothetical protein
MNYLLDGTLDATVFKANETQINTALESVQAEIETIEKELKENKTQDILEERIKRLKTLLSDYVSVDSGDKKIPELVVSAFVKQIIVYEDHFEWYLRTDGSDTPIICSVQGRANTDKEFSLSDSFYLPGNNSPYCSSSYRLLSRANC